MHRRRPHGTVGLIVLGVLCLTSLAFPQKAASASNVPATLEELEQEITRAVREGSIPGAAVAIVSRDTVLWQNTFGCANLQTGEPVTEHTRFCIGSCTKSFTGLAFLKLLDEGKIDLYTPVRYIAPEIAIDNPWHDTHPVRIIHLLEHTAGFEDSHFNWFYFHEPVLTLRQALQAKAHLRTVRWPPGTRFAYSSPGITLAGYVLEKVSGRPYREFMQENVLKPMGIQTATIGSSRDRRRLAAGYGNGNQPVDVYYDYDEPAGALNASIQDMATFVQFLLNEGKTGEQQLISARLFAGIGKPATTLAAQAGLVHGYSFGIGTRYAQGVRWYGHSGAVPGFLAEYYYSPEQQLGFVVLQNSFDTVFNDAVFALVWQFLNGQAAARQPPAAYTLPGETAKRYCGYYEPRNPRMRVMALGEVLAGGLTVFYASGSLHYKGFMSAARPFVPVKANMFRRPDDSAPRYIFFDTHEGMALATRNAFYLRNPGWKPIILRTFVFGAFGIMLLGAAYALFWVPVYVYKRLRKRCTCPYIPMRVMPLLAVCSLVLGVVPFMAKQPTMLELGQRTTATVIFYVSTLLFAMFSLLGLYTAFRSFGKPVGRLDRVFALLFSVACFGMTLYLYYYDIIGLKMWCY